MSRPECKILSIIPAPPESQIVEGPYDTCDEDSISYEPCACLALVENVRTGERDIVPCGFAEQLHPELTHHTAQLVSSVKAAQLKVESLQQYARTRLAKKLEEEQAS